MNNKDVRSIQELEDLCIFMYHALEETSERLNKIVDSYYDLPEDKQDIIFQKDLVLLQAYLLLQIIKLY